MIGNSKCACMPINIFNRHININIFYIQNLVKSVFEIMLKFRIVINDGISD